MSENLPPPFSGVLRPPFSASLRVSSQKPSSFNLRTPVALYRDPSPAPRKDPGPTKREPSCTRNLLASAHLPLMVSRRGASPLPLLRPASPASPALPAPASPVPTAASLVSKFALARKPVIAAAPAAVRASSAAPTAASESEIGNRCSPATISECLTGDLGASLPAELQSRYLLVPGARELGRGAFARIRKIRLKQKDPLANRVEYALKSIDKRELSIRDLLGQAKREVALHKEASKCRQVVGLVDFLEEEHFVHLVLEYCPAFTLAHYKPKFPDEVVHCVLSQLAAALNFLHNELHCIHRDVAPGNVLVAALKPRLVIRLGDFGWATSCAPEPGATVQGKAGTVAFMAPEILADLPYAFPVDIYALGRTLSFCTNASFPAATDTLQVYLNKDHKAMLAADPQARPTAAWLAAHYTRFDVSGAAIS